MPPRMSVDERLQRLRDVRDEGDLVKIREATTKFLTDGTNLVVAEAAKLIGEFALSGLEPVLLSTWERLVKHSDPIKADKGCTAKAAVIEALGQLDYDEPEFFLTAITYHQIEPAWPAAEDTAENVRGGCAFALARSQRLRIVDKLNAFVNYLQGSRADRINAAKSIADTGHETAIPLLRLKLLLGDGDAEVMGVCMSGLLDLAPLPSIPLVAEFLSNPTENVVLEAAAALGICGKPAAVEALIATWKRTGSKDLQNSLLLSIGLSRDAAALNFLISQLESNIDVETVLDALKPSCVYQETRDRVRSIIEKIGDKQWKAAFERKYGTSDLVRDVGLDS